MKIRQIMLALLVGKNLFAAVGNLGPELPANFFYADQTEEKLAADKSKVIPSLSKIADLYVKKDFDKLGSELKKIESNQDLADYFHYLSGITEYEKMKKHSSQSRWQNVVSAGDKVSAHLKEVSNVNPYTVLSRRAQVVLGLSETLQGDAYSKLKNVKRSRNSYENSFQRLSEKNLLVLVNKNSVTNYVLLCDKKPDELCTSWEIKLSAVYPKSEKSKVFARLSKISIPSVDKTSTAQYKAPELDLQDFQDGFNSYLAGKYENAFKTWYELLKKYPKTSIKLRTKFWMARAAQKMSMDAQSETLFREVMKEIPFSFYALSSSWHSGIDIQRTVDSQVPFATSELTAANPTDIIHLKKAETFIASKAYEFAKYELKEITPREAMSNEFLVYLAMLHTISQNYVGAFHIFSELSNRGYYGFFSSFGEKLVFPQVFSGVIKSSADMQRLDHLIAMSLIKQESAFNQEALSGSNAFGLMQIIPPTARDLDPNIKIESLFDPEQNTKLGIKYVRQLLKRYNGDIIYTLAAYNAGPGNADRWKKDAESKGITSPEEIIELISFRETHDYVQNILRNYYWYNKRLRGEVFVNLPAMLQYFQTLNLK